MSAGGTSYSYDRADRPNDAVSTVDPNGSITASGTSNFGYDAANRLTSLGASYYSATYSYDGDGNRERRHASGAPETNDFDYTYDVSRALPSLLEEDSTNSDLTTTNLTRKFVWGMGLAYLCRSGP